MVIETCFGVVNTQYNIQMVYYKIVFLKLIILLTNITPINPIKNKIEEH